MAQRSAHHLDTAPLRIETIGGAMLPHAMKRLLAVALLVTASCRQSEPPAVKGQLSYDDEIHKWQKTRSERLQSEDGWLSLAGLYWLNEGASRLGSDKAANDV